MAGSFGRRDPEEKPATAAPSPVPVLHVGEVHAELRLTITEETLNDLGSQIASMIANAAKQGFEAGMTAAMGELSGDADGGQAYDRGGETPTGLSFVVNDTSQPEPLLTQEDLRRARGETP